MVATIHYNKYMALIYAMIHYNKYNYMEMKLLLI